MSRFRVPLSELDAVQVDRAEQQESQPETRPAPPGDAVRPQPWLDGTVGGLDAGDSD